MWACKCFTFSLLQQSGDGSAGKVPAGTDVTVVYAIVGAFDGGTLWN